MEAGSLLVLPPGTMHCEVYVRGVLPRVSWIGLELPAAEVLPENCYRRRIDAGPKALREAEGILKRVAQEREARQERWQQMIDLELHRLLLLLERWASTAAPAGGQQPDKQPVAPRMREIAQRAAAFLADHCSEPLRVGDVARQFHLSNTHFGAIFRQVIGLSPKRYLLAARLAKARMLLEQGELTHATIAQECGFYDESHFNRAFRQYIGHAPGADGYTSGGERSSGSKKRLTSQLAGPEGSWENPSPRQ